MTNDRESMLHGALFFAIALAMLLYSAWAWYDIHGNNHVATWFHSGRYEEMTYE